MVEEVEEIASSQAYKLFVGWNFPVQCPEFLSKANEVECNIFIYCIFFFFFEG